MRRKQDGVNIFNTKEIYSLGLYHNYSCRIEWIIRHTFYDGRRDFMNGDYIDNFPLVAIIFFLTTINNSISENTQEWEKSYSMINETTYIIGNRTMEEPFFFGNKEFNMQYGITAKNNKEYLENLIRRMEQLAYSYKR